MKCFTIKNKQGTKECIGMRNWWARYEVCIQGCKEREVERAHVRTPSRWYLFPYIFPFKNDAGYDNKDNDSEAQCAPGEQQAMHRIGLAVD